MEEAPAPAPARVRVPYTPLSPRAFLGAVRPRQWTKNVLLFVALAFTLQFLDLSQVLRTVGAFALFCMLSSAGYLLNDVADVEADRQHPTKRYRAIASGAVPVRLALVLGVALAVGGVAGCTLIRPSLGVVAAAYLALTASYTIWFKHMVLLDVFGIAAGFVLRAAAGAVAINVPISPWLYTATMLGALMIALGKRRAELQVLGVDAAGHRKNLQAYSVELIDQLILVVSSAAVMTYALYTFSAENLPKDHSMMLTIPLVLYGLFRYLFLVHGGTEGGAPEELLLRDRPLLITIVLWGLLAVGVLYVARL